MYLHDWQDSGFFGMVADFSGVHITKDQFEADASPWPNAGYWSERKAAMKAALEDPKWADIEVLLASYTYRNYEGSAFVLFRKHGKLYEVNGGHCSCFGLEGQWDPEETGIEELHRRLVKGTFGTGVYGNEFADELRAVLRNLTTVN